MSVDPPQAAVREAVARALEEDLGPLGDLTAALVPAEALVSAQLVSRQAGVLAGRRAATEAFLQVDPGVSLNWAAADGDSLSPGHSMATVQGRLTSVLTAERTALNFLCHLSGVATLTARYVDAAGASVRIRDTRKTTPGLRALEKAAVRAGGGVNHRASLSDGILVKDNHLAGLSIEEALERARRMWPGRSVQVECDTAQQVKRALAAGAELVLLDNMTPDQVAECVSMVRAGTGPDRARAGDPAQRATRAGDPAQRAARAGNPAQRAARARCLVEVSGGVTLDTVGAYAATGADLVSVGAITHSAPALDIGLDLDAPTAP